MRYVTGMLASAIAVAAMHPTPSLAQNLVDNANFYSTMSPWKTYTPDVTYFTSSVNHTPGGGGSVFLGGKSGSIATQCIGITNGLQYVLTAWTYSACVGSRLYVFWSNGTCDVGSDYDYVVSTVSGEWEQVTIVSDQAPDKNRAIVMLDNPGGCADGVFFDDVSLQRDSIFWGPFDMYGVEAK